MFLKILQNSPENTCALFCRTPLNDRFCIVQEDLRFNLLGMSKYHLYSRLCYHIYWSLSQELILLLLLFERYLDNCTPRKIAPRLGLECGSRSRLVLGLEGGRGEGQPENWPRGKLPIRVRVWLRVKQENDYYEFRQENDLPESCLQESYLKIHFRTYTTTLIVNLPVSPLRSTIWVNFRYPSQRTMTTQKKITYSKAIIDALEKDAKYIQR